MDENKPIEPEVVKNDPAPKDWHKAPEAKPVVRKLTVRQSKYVRGVLEGKTKSQAALDAGYSEKTHQVAASNEGAVVKNALAEAMQRIGINDEFLAKTLKQGLKATETQYFASEGKVLDKRKKKDYSVRERYFRDACEVVGYIKNANIESLNIGLIHTPIVQSESEWNEKKDAV